MNSNVVDQNTQPPFNRTAPFKYLALATLLCQSVAANAVGFSQIVLPDVTGAELHVGVWYPSDTAPPSTANTPFNQALAMDAPVSGDSRSLVLLSHGYGGWMGGHADTALALAEAGFVVAAPTHAGNNFKDMSSPIEKWALDRPQHISASIDYLRQEWDQHAVLNDAGVGVFGFSAGGYTALSLIGAVPDLSVAKRHCDSTPEEFVCGEGFIDAMLEAQMLDLPAKAWGADARITAASIAAPGLGIAYDQAALANVRAKVQLWSGLDDKRVPHQSNALPIAQVLGAQSENHWQPDAGHFAFMLPACTEKHKKFEPESWKLVCVDKAGFDRAAFHTHMNTEIAQFFERELR